MLRLSYFHKGGLLAKQALGNVEIGDGGAPAGPENEGLALVGAQHHLGVLRHNAQQGQAGGVHGVVNGGAKAAEQPGLYPVDHQMDAGDAVPEHRNRALGVPQGGTYLRGLAPLLVCPGAAGLAVIAVLQFRRPECTYSKKACMTLLAAACGVILVIGLVQGVPALLAGLGV